MTFWVITQDNWFGVTTQDPNPIVLPGVFNIIELEGYPPELKDYSWNFTSNSFIKTGTSILTRVDFILRFTATEWNAAVLSTDPNIKQGLALVAAAEFVDVDDVRTMMLVGYCAMIGIVTNPRVAEILA